MYYYDQLTGIETSSGGNEIVLRPSQRFHYSDRLAYAPSFSSPFGPASWSSYGLGSPPPPKGLKLLEHLNFARKPDPSNPAQFLVGVLATLTTEDMNPGFIDAADKLIVDTSSNGLHTCLGKLITSQFNFYLSSKTATGADKGDRLRVALVDLTGDKLTKPDFAGWGSPLAMYGASCPKMLAVYAAHQMRNDLRQFAKKLAISDGKVLKKAALDIWKLKSDKPNLDKLLDISSWSGSPDTINFSADIRKAFHNISENWGAARVIRAVGFPYIASVTWQSGLYHPSRGGMWLGTSYDKGRWAGNPFSMTANVTALSAATYFTLLAQGRLVGGPSSIDIRNVLARGCVSEYFPLSSITPKASKCGVFDNYHHDCVLVDRGSTRYVAVVLSRTPKKEKPKYEQLFEELDKLIVKNNQTPRPVC